MTLAKGREFQHFFRWGGYFVSSLLYIRSANLVSVILDAQVVSY